MFDQKFGQPVDQSSWHIKLTITVSQMMPWSVHCSTNTWYSFVNFQSCFPPKLISLSPFPLSTKYHWLSLTNVTTNWSPLFISLLLNCKFSLFHGCFCFSNSVDNFLRVWWLCFFFLVFFICAFLALFCFVLLLLCFIQKGVYWSLNLWNPPLTFKYPFIFDMHLLICCLVPLYIFGCFSKHFEKVLSIK